MYHLHTLIHMSYVYLWICLTRKGNTTIIEAPFLGSGCGRLMLITNMNLLLLLIFFLLLAVFRFILNRLPFKWYKVPTMLLEKVSIHTEFLFVHCYNFFYYYLFFDYWSSFFREWMWSTNNKNLGKRIKIPNHTCTIHRNTTNSFIPHRQ
jgi:hypothetical protein